ncbi:MAG: hypothetical protein AAFO96_23075 [Bacteroidota bacterium]
MKKNIFTAIYLIFCSLGLVWGQAGNVSPVCPTGEVHYNHFNQKLEYLENVSINIQPSSGNTELLGVPSPTRVQTVAGNPDAFLDYLYDFEDGHYFMTHLNQIPYGSIPFNGGSERRRVYVTGRYSPLDSIPDDPERSAGMGTGDPAPNDRFTDGYVYLEANRSVVPNQSITFAISYQAYDNIKPDGFFLLYNHGFPYVSASVSLKCVDTYRGETATPFLLNLGPHTLSNLGVVNIPQAAHGYGGAVEFTNIGPSLSQVGAPEKEHTVFVTFNSEIPLEGLEEGQSARFAILPYVDKGSEEGSRKIPLEFVEAPQPIARAHDPNFIIADRNSYIRGIDSGGNPVYPGCVEVNYLAHFQNIGEAPATRVDLAIPIDARLQTGTFEIVDWSPKVMLTDQDTACASSTDPYLYYEVDCQNPGSLYFSFHNVAIQGTKDQTADPRLPSTGWVKYKMKTLPISQHTTLFGSATKAQADITFFDAQGILPSIQTNVSKIELELKDFEIYGAFPSNQSVTMDQYYPNCVSIPCEFEVTPCLCKGWQVVGHCLSSLKVIGFVSVPLLVIGLGLSRRRRRKRL